MDSYTQFSDFELVALLRNSDERAFDLLFRRFYPSLCFFARRFVSVEGMAEEVVQDSLFKLWQRRKDFENYNAVKAFLYISTKNACRDGADQEQRKLNRDNQWYLQQEIMEQDAEDHMIKAEVLMEISKVINQLPEQCRRVMKMSYEQGMSGKEIAEIMGVSVSTVNNQKARGLSLMRKSLSVENLSLAVFLLSIADTFGKNFLRN